MYADSSDPLAQRLSLDEYRARAVAPRTLVQERIEYVARVTDARALQLAREAAK